MIFLLHRNWQITTIIIGGMRGLQLAPPAGISDLSHFYSEFRQGDAFEDLPVYCEVSCGRPIINVGNRIFEVNTWLVIIRVQLSNAEIKATRFIFSTTSKR